VRFRQAFYYVNHPDRGTRESPINLTKPNFASVPGLPFWSSSHWFKTQ